MNATDTALFNQIANPLDDRPVDMIWILRGGATDVYTLISNLAALQRRLPNHHLSDIAPYIMADSAGAYPAAGLVVANPIDPLALPSLFKKNIHRYLSRDRNEAEAALIEDIGTAKIRDTILPISLSTVEITQGVKTEYFTNFPQAYSDARPGFKAPQNRNDDIPLSKAVLASSAFAFFLGECKIEDRRFMDLAFLEIHPVNLVEYYKAHAQTSPERRVVCVVFGNNYIDLELGQTQKLHMKGLNRHFNNVMRARVQNDLTGLASSLFGAENVFDLSLYIKQPFAAQVLGPTSHAFRSDEDAIRERVIWTDQQLKNSLSHHAMLDHLAEIIKRGSFPHANMEALNTHPEKSLFEGNILPLGLKKRIIGGLRDIAPTAAILTAMAGDTIQPLVESTRSAASWLNTRWSQVSNRTQTSSPPSHSNPEADVATQLAQLHSSEPHTPPEYENKLP